MSFEAVSERLTALQESNAQLQELIKRLATIKFQPGTIPLDDEEGNAMVELSAEIHQMLKDQDEDFGILQEDIHDLNPGQPGSELEQKKMVLDNALKRAVKELNSCEGEFRRAQLSARSNLQQAQREERQLLLQSYLAEPSENSEPPLTQQQRRRTQRSSDMFSADKEVNASSDVTAALRRTHDMMFSELSRSQFAHDTLKKSTAALADLNENYYTLDTLLSNSRNLLGTLLRSQKSDTWYLETAFYILLATIAWLFWRRILYGPTWWLVWFPARMIFRSSTNILTGLGVIGIHASTSAQSISSSLLSIPTVVHNQATGRLSAPPGAASRAPPSINVGGGGRGAPMRGQNSLPPHATPHTMTDQVEEIIDDSRKEQWVGGEGRGKEQPNPKKRMWDEPREAEKEAQRMKDEL